MIEAVNSVLSNATYTKAAIEQQSVVQSFAANPSKVQVVPQAPFISPYVHVDVNYDKAVLQLRDSATGDVVRQIPTESQLEAYKRAQTAALKPKQDSAPKPDVQVQSSAPSTTAQTDTVEISGSSAPEIKTPAPTIAAPETPLPQASSSETSFVARVGTIVSVDTQA